MHKVSVLHSMYFRATLLLALILLLPLKADCPFCDNKVLQKQAFYEDDLVIALCTHKPILPGHTLIIPKRHVARFEELTTEEIARIGEVIKKVDKAASKVFFTSSYLLHQKNGVEVGQSVFHVHFHYIPRKLGDRSMVSFFWHMVLAQVRGPVPDMENSVSQLKAAIDY